jgi:quinol monooxygenase YgiN
VDNPNELRLFQEYRNLDAYRVHESNPYMREMMECLGNYLEDESEMEFIEGEEFAI